MGSSNDVWLFDPEKRVWEQIFGTQLLRNSNSNNDIPPPSPNAVGAVLNDVLYTYDGRHYREGTVWGFDLKARRWQVYQNLDPAPPATWNSGAFTRGGANPEFVVVGGQRGRNLTSAVWGFSPTTHTWRRLPSLPVFARGMAAAASTDGGRGAIVFGGSGMTPSAPAVVSRNDILAFDSVNEQWIPLLAGLGPSPRENACLVATSNDRYILFGGRHFNTTGFVSHDDVYELDVSGGQARWTNRAGSISNDGTSSNPTKWESIRCVMIEDVMYVIAKPNSPAGASASLLRALDTKTWRWFDPAEGGSLVRSNAETDNKGSGVDDGVDEAELNRRRERRANIGTMIGGILGVVALLSILIAMVSIVVNRKRMEQRTGRKADYLPPRRESLLMVYGKGSKLGSKSGDVQKRRTIYSTSVEDIMLEYGDQPVLLTDATGRIRVGEKYIARYGYVPMRADEIEVKAGDVVLLRTIYPDQWGIVYQESTGRAGMVPLKCLGDPADRGSYIM
ncbi:hypothetical protein HK102_005310 [Quaeritorhiza haematococci]|nr:hypothetical protein HK102_005310 [Quaeritorhiza haematococci]